MDKKYQSPEIEIIECVVEKGFVQSDDKYDEIGFGTTPGIPD